MSHPPAGPLSARQSADRPVHLLGGLPTSDVLRGLDRLRAVLPVRSLAGFASPMSAEWIQMGVLLPPHVETSQVVEEWERREYLAKRFGRGTGIGNVLTLVGTDFLAEHLPSTAPMSARGWGRGTRDARAVADIAVGQIESSTHLILVGDATSNDELLPALGALNPNAVTLVLEDASDADLYGFVTRLERTGSTSRRALSARVVPPWLELLQAEPSARRHEPNRFLYRRSRPFDPESFREWLADPPQELLRGKGKVWLANRCDEAFGYSCAGAVHRIFDAGGWWATAGSTWPSSERERRRLLDRWHPRFGDRRQEIAFVGVDLDQRGISETLDACLLSENETVDVLQQSGYGPSSRLDSAPPGGLN